MKGQKDRSTEEDERMEEWKDGKTEIQKDRKFGAEMPGVEKHGTRSSGAETQRV